MPTISSLFIARFDGLNHSFFAEEIQMPARGGLIDQPLDDFSAKFRAWVVNHAGDQPTGLGLIDLFQPFNLEQTS